MKDTIIKGSGNSRTIKSVPNFATLFSTWEAFRDKFGTEGIPIDLLGLNAAGINQAGTDLNKANMLTDATEQAIWGSAADRTPDAALQQLRSLITAAQNTANLKATIEITTYTGTGATTKSINFSHNPKFVLITRSETINQYGELSNATFMLGIYGQSTVVVGVRSGAIGAYGAKATWSGNTLTLSTQSSDSNKSWSACNESGRLYYCIGI